jgi:molecular chaperone GrpE
VSKLATEETKNMESQPNVEETDEKIEAVFAEEEVNTANEESAIVDELKAKLDEADNRYLRLQADFDNYRRRMKLDFEAAEKYRAQAIILELLPAMDNFERALKAEVDNDQAKSLLQGMEMIYRSLLEAIKREGAEPIEAVGEQFDPHLHQAVMQVEAEGTESGIVLEEFQKGYKLKDRVIRPSMVKVSQ